MTTDPKPLNQVEVWVAEHAVPIFLGIALAIVLGAAAVFYNWQKQGDTANEVHVLAPQVTKITQAICDRASLEDDRRARACAERIRIGLVNCRQVDRCRAAYLALATYPPPSPKPTSPTSPSTAATPEGVMPQQPSNNGHQQPGPSGGQQGGGDQGQGEGAAQAPPPAAGGESPSEGSQGGQGGAQGSQGGSTSGVGVEVCADHVNTCIGVEVGLGH